MSLKIFHCRSCGAKLAWNARNCSVCRHLVSNDRAKGWIIIMGVIVILLLAVIVLLSFFGMVCFASEAPGFGYGVRVGIIDSGVNKTCENVLDGFNYLENNTDTTDNKGHGSIIAGIILEIAPNVKIIPLKCTERNKVTDNSSIITAIYKAVDDFDCDVINISIGMPDSEKLKAAVDYAVKNGAIVVAAVGNDGELSYKKSKIYYPAGYENVIGVGSVDEKNAVSAFSQKNKSVFVVTSGESKKYSGTSYAAARISGAAAIAKSFNKQMPALLFMKYLKDASADYGDKGYDTSYGNGILNFELLKKSLKADNPVYVTYLDEQVFKLYNSKKEKAKGILIYIDCDKKVSSKDIEILPEKEMKFCFKNTEECFFLQSSIFDIVWIKKGEL